MTEFNYVALPQPPARERNYGRQAAPNPHRQALQAINGTGKILAFEIDAPTDEVERKRVYERHVRWLRQAAAEESRSIRLWRDDLEGGRMRITFQDANKRTRKTKGEGQQQVPGQMDLPMDPQQQRPTIDTGARQATPMAATFQG